MDHSVLLLVQDLRNGLGEGFAKAVTFFSDLVLSPVFYVLLAGVFWCFNKKKGLLYVFTLVGGNFINSMLKIMFCVFRPWVLWSDVQPYEFSKQGALGYSFPSGHSTSAGGLFGSFWWTERKKKLFRIGMPILIFLIGFSRLYLGVHTPQDVLVGWLSGFASLALFNFVLKWLDGKEHRDLFVLVSGLVILTIGLIATMLRNYPLSVNGCEPVDIHVLTDDIYSGLGMGYGLIIGWFVERRWIRFDVQGTAKEKILRYLLGCAGMVVVYILPKHFLYDSLGEQWGRFVLYFATLLYVVMIYPYCIAKLQQKFFSKKA